MRDPGMMRAGAERIRFRFEWPSARPARASAFKWIGGEVRVRIPQIAGKLKEVLGVHVMAPDQMGY